MSLEFFAKSFAISISITAYVALIMASIISANLKAQITRQNSNHRLFPERTTAERFTFLTSFQLLNFLLLILLSVVTVYYMHFEIAKLYKILSDPYSVDDFRWYYTASKMAGDGVSPYRFEDFTQYFFQHMKDQRDIGPFAYPPSLIPLIYPFSYFSFPSATIVFFSINLLGTILLLYGTLNLLELKTVDMKLCCLCICTLIFGITFGLFLGNISNLVVCLIVWTVVYAKKNKDILAGFLLGVSTIKPTLAILFIFYFLAKKRFSLILYCMITSLILLSLGILISHTSALDFFGMYRSGMELFFRDYWNSAYTSPTRIDIGVIGTRLFPNSATLSNFLDILLKTFPSLMAGWYLYRSQKASYFLGIQLSEVSLISCLSILLFYSQPSNSSLLVFVAVFLINHLSSEILSKRLYLDKIILWCIAATFFVIHTHITYRYITSYMFKRSVSHIVLVSIGSIPNYSVLALIITIFILAKNRGKKQMNFSSYNVFPS